jgi:hypothetical protein
MKGVKIDHPKNQNPPIFARTSAVRPVLQQGIFFIIEN